MDEYRMISVYLLKIDNPTFKRCIIDGNGMMKSFPGIEKELEFPLSNKTQF